MPAMSEEFETRTYRWYVPPQPQPVRQGIPRRALLYYALWFGAGVAVASAVMAVLR